MNINNEPGWIEVNCEGEFTGIKYFGKFQVKPYLTLGERRDAGVLASTYVRGVTEDDSMRQLLAALATLKFHIVKSESDWWVNDGLQLLDEQPIMELVKLINEMQRPKKEPEADKDS